MQIILLAKTVVNKEMSWGGVGWIWSISVVNYQENYVMVVWLNDSSLLFTLMKPQKAFIFLGNAIFHSRVANHNTQQQIFRLWHSVHSILRNSLFLICWLQGVPLVCRLPRLTDATNWFPLRWSCNSPLPSAHCFTDYLLIGLSRPTAQLLIDAISALAIDFKIKIN